MSAPKSKQCRQIIERVSTLLDEYDDAAYALVVQDRKGTWHYMTRLGRRDKVDVARTLLDFALTPPPRRKKHRNGDLT